MTRTYWMIALLILAAVWAGSAWVYPVLPQRVPTHWNIQGQVDGWGDKTWAVFLTPMIMIVFLILFAFLPALSPKPFEVDSFRSTYLYVMVLMALLFAYIQGLILYATWKEVKGAGGLVDTGRLLIGGIFLFFALLGNVLGKVRRNFYIGVRVPWTLASDRVWNDTHRLAAWLMVIGGILGFVMVLVGLPIVLAIVALVGSLIVPVVYSFVHYKALERRGAL
jgi:uncharacterized membrane protein